MTQKKKRNPLIAEEDWWTVWFGLTILLVATVLGILTLTGSISSRKVPRMGRWVSSPVDLFYHARKSRIDIKEGSTLATLADGINATGSGATARVVPDGGGVRLRVASSRTGDAETISLRTLLAGGEQELEFGKEGRDPDGLGARAYV